MGQIFTFRCSSCDYSADVSGGLDYGFRAATLTCVCLKCNELVDVYLGEIWIVQNKSNNDINNLDLKCCPNCKEVGKLIKWKKKKRPCPKCGGQMDKDPMGTNVLWD